MAEVVEELKCEDSDFGDETVVKVIEALKKKRVLMNREVQYIRAMVKRAKEF